MKGDDLSKVGVRPGGMTHVENPGRHGWTLCGRRWWFSLDLGSDTYCCSCQANLAKLKRKWEASDGNDRAESK